MDGEEAIGVLKINFKTEEVLDLISATGVEDVDRILLARENGEVIVSSDGVNERLHQDTVRLMRAGDSSGYTRSEYFNRSVVLGFAQVMSDISVRVPNPGEITGVSGESWESERWFVVFEQERGRILAPITSIMNSVIIMNICIILVITFLTFLFVYKFVSFPIKKLTKTADDISRGKFDTQLGKIDSKDEIGDLARAFDRTVVSLKLAMRETSVFEEKKVNKK